MLTELREKYIWPETCPDVSEDPSGWLCGENKKTLSDVITRDNPLVVLELGAWLGMSTRFLCEQTSDDCTVVTIDHWLGSSEHQTNPILPVLYETFVKNCWKYRHKLIPLRTTTLEGVREVFDADIVPNLIYVDASHETDLVIKDLDICLTLFPEATIVGDDWTWTSVKEGVFEILRKFKCDIRTFRTCYELKIQ